MQKLRVAWASPLPPLKSGIADYAEELLRALARTGEVELTVLHEGAPPEVSLEGPAIRLTPRPEFDALDDRMPHDVTVYHMGNHPCHDWIWKMARRFRGMIVAHDACFHHFFLGRLLEANRPEQYLHEMLNYHGSAGDRFAREYLRALGTPEIDACTARLFENSYFAPISEAAVRVVVHNRHARGIAETAGPTPVEVIPIYFNPDHGYLPRKAVAAAQLGVPPGVPLILSMGFVTAHKRLDRALAALGRLAREGIAFHLVIAGQISHELPYRLDERIADEGLQSRVSVRGYVKRAELLELLSAADLAINLRYPTAGESSASLIQFLGCGVPTLVSDHGASAELPDTAVAKIPWDEREASVLTGTLRDLLTRPDEREALGRRAHAHVLSHHTLPRVVDRYLGAMRATAADAAQRMVQRAEKNLIPLLDPLRLHPKYGDLQRRIVERWNGVSGETQDEKP